MKESIHLLISLQKLDQELDRLERAKGDLPARVRKLEAENAELQHAVQEQEAQLQALHLRKAQLELNVQQLRADKKKFDEQLYAVTTNKEYDAVTHQIEAAMSAIDEAETEILQIMDEEKVGTEKLAALQADAKKTAEDLVVQSAALQRKIEANAEVTGRLKEEREAIAGRIKKSYLSRYDVIRKAKDGLAVVPVVRGACGGCFTNIPPQRAMEVRDEDKFIGCESCGRILYWLPEKEAAEAV